jgi:hypothetical protein
LYSTLTGASAGRARVARLRARRFTPSRASANASYPPCAPRSATTPAGRFVAAVWPSSAERMSCGWTMTQPYPCTGVIRTQNRLQRLSTTDSQGQTRLLRLHQCADRVLQHGSQPGVFPGPRASSTCYRKSARCVKSSVVRRRRALDPERRRSFGVRSQRACRKFWRPMKKRVSEVLAGLLAFIDRRESSRPCGPGNGPDRQAGADTGRGAER